MHTYPFQTIDWSLIPGTEHRGSTGIAYWKTLQLPGLRIRRVTYSENYLADHWCRKGHIVYCLSGSFVTEQQDGSTYTLSEGMMYVVSDEKSTHKSYSKDGVELLIIDGDFLAS